MHNGAFTLAHNTLYSRKGEYLAAMISKDKILQILGLRRQHRCNDLVAYPDVFPLLQEAERQDRSLQSVPLRRIVGSTGRFNDFDLAFAPRHDADDGRLASIAQARERAVALPPPLLYKVAEAYFVEDGNHRVSVARAHGDETIRARVIEIDPSGLVFEPSCSRLGFKIKDDRHIIGSA